MDKPETTPLLHESLALVIVDDARTSRAFFQRALAPAGYTDIRIVDAAEAALETLAERPADVVIADWLMPGMDGIELSGRIRSRDEEEGRYTAIILSTGREGVEALVHAFRHGVDDFLRKPFDSRELVARVFAAGNQANAQNALLDTRRTLANRARARADHWSLDEITGLGNAAYFEAQLGTHLAEAGTRGGAVCCALIEVAGPGGWPLARNGVLAPVGRRIARTVRPTDVVCRLGDNRFGLVLSAADARGFRDRVFGRIERELTGRPLPLAEGPQHITMRFGQSVWQGPGSAATPAELVDGAERMLEDAPYGR